MRSTTVGPVDWAVEMLAGAATVGEVERILRSSARAGVGAHGATVVRLEGDRCYYADEDAASPLWKGQRFPVRQCISGWSMLHRQTVVVPDIFVDDRIPHDAYRPTFVRSLMMVPIRVDAPVGAIGVYWADLHRASAEEVALVERLAGAADAALARVAATTDASTAATADGVANTDEVAAGRDVASWDDVVAPVGAHRWRTA